MKALLAILAVAGLLSFIIQGPDKKEIDGYSPAFYGALSRCL
jgi:hypothetical protein